ncbi:hypothetical protein IC229_07745 [Spirosoma sp. BT702]|uniref:Uncharacterized protein n=1 Tax=Spirosoma profusum TaxID=2771354 RepID=A0A926XUK2_9BACT|nr:hypothetical protein [Spirosoma profusum]MBD2700522.1 hypothetical protein [Spirosoma profusum]
MAEFAFGLYPGSATGAESGLVNGPADIPERIRDALDDLQPTDKSFRVRVYVGYAGNGQIEHTTPTDFTQYVAPNRKLDLVLCYRAVDDPFECWTDFIRTMLQQYAPHLATLQITEEANSTGPGGDGITPNIRAALVAGILAAKAEIQRLNVSIEVGFSATINFNPADDFWRELYQLGGQSFVDALDYVALDFFPDVFTPLPPNVTLWDAVRVVLEQFRQVNLPQAGIPATVPIHIGENGWPTNSTRTYERQAETLEAIIRAVYAHRATFNITLYELFDLRDADSSQENIFYQFGIMRDDYSPKPAYTVFKKLIAELTC